MEPPHTAPRLATTSFTRLWRTTDVADRIAQFLPAKGLAALPVIAQQFERDSWRQLAALSRRAGRGTAAACKSGVLSTLQSAGHPDAGHFREAWMGQALSADAHSPDEVWKIMTMKSAEEHPDVEFTTMSSGGKLVVDRRTARWANASVTVRQDLENCTAVGGRCCVQRFRVSLAYTGNNEGNDGGGTGSIFRLGSTYDKRGYRRFLCMLYIRSDSNGAFHLRWRCGEDITATRTLKIVNSQHTFLIDATLDWDTATATVTIDGVALEQPVPFDPLPFRRIYFNAEDSGTHTLGPVDVWYSNTPPPQPVLSVRFATDTSDSSDSESSDDE